MVETAALQQGNEPVQQMFSRPNAPSWYMPRMRRHQFQRVRGIVLRSKDARQHGVPRCQHLPALVAVMSYGETKCSEV